MRAKPFKARPSFWRPDEYSKPSDAEVGADGVEHLVTEDGVTIQITERSALAQLVIHYRAMLWRHDDRPRREEVRATLGRLAAMRQEEAATRWRKLDAADRAEIERAAWMMFRRKHGPNAMYSKGIKHIKNGPDNLPEIAAFALGNMQREEAGRPRVTAIAVAFASDLAAYWFITENRQPRAYNTANDPHDFHEWAQDLFTKAGFSTGDIVKNLKDGIEAAKQAGRIPK